MMTPPEGVMVNMKAPPTFRLICYLLAGITLHFCTFSIFGLFRSLIIPSYRVDHPKLLIAR